MYILSVVIALVVCLYLILDKKIHVQKELLINKKVEDVWEVMGNQFAEVHLWSTNFKDSKPGGSSKFSGLGYSERVTITNRGVTVQELDAFDAANYTLAYHISKGAPSIAAEASAVWSLKSNDDNTTSVRLVFNMKTKGYLGFLMTPLIKIGMGKSATEIAEDLKHYIENGVPHPRKVKSI